MGGLNQRDLVPHPIKRIVDTHVAAHEHQTGGIPMVGRDPLPLIDAYQFMGYSVQCEIFGEIAGTFVGHMPEDVYRLHSYPPM